MQPALTRHAAGWLVSLLLLLVLPATPSQAEIPPPDCHTGTLSIQCKWIGFDCELRAEQVQGENLYTRSGCHHGMVGWCGIDSRYQDWWDQGCEDFIGP